MSSNFLPHRMGLSLIVMLALAACTGAPKARVDRDSDANFENYRTFSWMEPKATAADESMQADSLARRRAHASVSTALQDKGYTLDETHPDVRVSYAIHVYERPKQSGLRVGVGAGGGSGNVAGGVGVSLPIGKRIETVAAMTVDVFDAARNAPVWHGSAEMVLSGDIATEVDVRNLTDSILAKYPAPGK